MEYVGFPSCVTVNVLPAMVIVPVLWVVDVLAETEYVTVPLPVPLVPEVMVIHDALLAAVQVQLPDEAVTLTLPVPPDELNNWLVGLIVKVQVIPS
jgi:hypothetical protein